MKSNNPRIERLKEMMSLEERRGQLQAELDELTGRMNALKDRLFEDGAEVQSTPTSSKQNDTSSSNTRQQTTKSAKSAKGGTSKRAPRGALRDQIMTALEAAGPAGIKVKELSEAIGTKAVNIHSWFHSTVKRNPAIKKISGGHYRLEGGSSKAAKQPAPQQAPAKPQSTAAKKTTKPAKSGKRGGGTSKRGELSSRILSELENAGSGGLAVKDLADKVGAKYKNIYIWFATTGKKNSSIKKVGPAHYRLA
jgi:ribosome-binding protein aMBF1 (putative translation factor)